MRLSAFIITASINYDDNTVAQKTSASETAILRCWLNSNLAGIRFHFCSFIRYVQQSGACIPERTWQNVKAVHDITRLILNVCYLETFPLTHRIEKE
jgi:hypothetical protein